MSDTPKKSFPLRRRRRRLMIVSLLLPALFGAAVLSLIAIQQTSVYFYAPRDIPPAAELDGRTIRIGGMVTEGSIKQGEGMLVRFDVTDCIQTVTVYYEGLLPGLFRAGQGVVVQGTLADSGEFTAAQVMAKHDENYMPPEVASAIEDTPCYEAFSPYETPA